MDENILKIVVGSLLHDIGKIVYRTGEKKQHSISGAAFLKNSLNIVDDSIVQQVRYHHYNDLKDAKIPVNSLAYITYISDNISSGIERREKEEIIKEGFNKKMSLESVFNLLNNSNDNKVYKPSELNMSQINYPVENNIEYDSFYYNNILLKIEEQLKDIEINEEYINSILEILEGFTSYVPSSTSNKEVADISLYEHLKLTAAFGSAIKKYLDNIDVENYKEELFIKSKEFYNKKSFILLGLDISGIQNYIYTIISKEALKGLRARSFYIEILLEHINDELLSELGLSRTNLLYSGGGGSYILADNTEETKNTIKEFIENTNRWLMENFDIELYIAYGYSEASSNDFRNFPKGSYRNIFKNISHMISKNKINRYTPEEIIDLNKRNAKETKRECRICKRSDKLLEDDICENCYNINGISNDIKRKDYLIVLNKKPEENYLKLPGEKYLIIQNESSLRKYQLKDEFIRAYSKNTKSAGYKIATKIWIGDYTKSDNNEEFDFADLAESSKGIKRLAVLRADIDNLGQAFVGGFIRENEDEDRYVTITRTATLSKRLSTFFKLHINEILKNGEFFIENRENKERNALVVYSGGDDLFIVGSWDDIIGISIDINNKFRKFTQNTLSISAGIGIFRDKYPISAMARETGVLEEFSKELEGKNAITLFENSEKLRFKWEELENDVLTEKYNAVKKLLYNSEEQGNATIYKILELLRNEDDINIARLAYQLSRLETNNNTKEYKENSKKIFKWAKNEVDKKQLIAAIYIYVYINRRR